MNDKECECGCGTLIPEKTKRGRPRRFVVGHNRRKRPRHELVACACGCGEQINRFNRWGRERRFVNHHASRVKRIYDSTSSASASYRNRNKQKAAAKWKDRSFPRKKRITCIDCGKRRLAKFAGRFDANGNPLFRSRCIECRALVERTLNSNYRATRRKELNRKSQERKQRRKAEAIAYLGGSCKQCGFIGAGREMTFHHRNPEEKAYFISQILDRRWALIEAELGKCDLLCFRCHMKHHDET